MDLKDFTISAILVGLFIVSFIFATVTFSNSNSIDNPFLKDTSVNSAFQNLSVQLNESQAKAQEKRDALTAETTTPILDLGFFILTSILDAGTVFMSMSIALFETIFKLPTELLGISPIVTGAIMSIVIITLILAVWKVWKQGE